MILQFPNIRAGSLVAYAYDLGRCHAQTRDLKNPYPCNSQLWLEYVVGHAHGIDYINNFPSRWPNEK